MSDFKRLFLHFFLYIIKPLLKKNPYVWSKIRKRIIFNPFYKRKSSQFLKLGFIGFNVNFSQGPLNDLRGIGRVAGSLLNEFKKSSQEIDSDVHLKEVHFYASIHWCPLQLPENSFVVIHDVIPLVLPEVFSDDVDVWRNEYKAIAHQAKKIITISESSMKDIHNYLGIDCNKIEVISNGVTSLPVADSVSFKIPKERFVIFLGAADKHKNLSVVLEAFKDNILSDIKLVLIGDNQQLISKVRDLGVDDRVIFLGYLEDKHVGYVVQHASALVFPSLYEGFGLPPFEAALLGTPSICSMRPSMTELLVDSALFADPTSPKDWANKIRMLVDNDLLAKQLVDNAQEKLKDMTWAKVAKKYIETFEKII